MTPCIKLEITEFIYFLISKVDAVAYWYPPKNMPLVFKSGSNGFSAMIV